MARTKRKVNPILPLPAPETAARRIYRTGEYVRLSVEDSGKPGADTIDNQIHLIEDYIGSQSDMMFCGLYCDNGKTGTNFERPAFEHLMEDVKAGKIDCIVVKDLSRFGRNYRETGNYLERIFPFLDVRFVAVNDHFDTMTAERTGDGYIVPLKNIINEVYSKDISRKSGSALAVKQRNGDFIGTWAAYGYRKCADNPRRIEPDEETAPVVRDIFQWRLSGMGYINIARKLNGAGIPSPGRYHYLKGDTKSERYASTEWHQQVIRAILQNEVYLGHMVQGRKRESLYEGQKQQQQPKAQWVVVKHTHEPLIDEETFCTVQKTVNDQKSNYNERLGKYDALGKSENIFKGLIYCADCKRPLVRYKSVTLKGTKVAYIFICPSHSDDPSRCPKKYIHEEELIAILWKTLKQQFELAGEMSKWIREWNRSEEFIGIDKTTQRETSAIKQTLERFGMLYDSLYPNYVNQLMTEQEYSELKRQYRQEIEQAEAKLDELKLQKISRIERTEDNRWLTACGHFEAETQLTEEMAKALIDRVEIDADNNLTVTFRYRDEYRLLTLLKAAVKEVETA